MSAIPPNFSERIDIRSIERRSRRLLGAGYLFAAVMLAILTLTWQAPPRVVWKEETPQRAMRFDLIELPAKPREEPYRMSAPKTAHALTRPERFPARPSLPRGKLKSPGIALAPGFESSFELPSGLGGIPASPEGRDSTRYAPGDAGIADTGVGGRIPEGRINLTDEYIDIGALDDGRSKAIMIRDPNDQRNVKGFVHIPRNILGSFLAPAAEAKDALLGLVEATYRYTGIKVIIDRPVFLNSPGLKKYPFIYISADVFFRLTPDEARCFREYLEGGGFALMEPFCPGDQDCGWPPAARAMIEMLKDTFGGKFQRTYREAEFRDMTREIQEKLGEPVRLRFIPNTGEFYRSFFALDISRGDAFPHFESKHPTAQPDNYLEGIWRQRRMALVYSEKEYGKAWSKMDDLRMWVNVLVFALSQPGGKTQQLVDGSTVTWQQKRTWWDYKSRMQYLDEEKSTLNPKYREKKP